jgi:hypothetical protein
LVPLLLPLLLLLLLLLPLPLPLLPTKIQTQTGVVAARCRRRKGYRQQGGRGVGSSRECERYAQPRVWRCENMHAHLFWRAFPMFVPSLSWQNDRFLYYINGSKKPFSAGGAPSEEQD